MGLAGLLCAARVGSVNGSTGTSFEMDATLRLAAGADALPGPLRPGDRGRLCGAVPVAEDPRGRNFL